MKVRFQTIFSIILLLFCGWVQDTSAQSSVNKPNVLFIAVDDLNTNLSSYGHSVVKTPNLDRLAKIGVQFDRAYAQFPLCSPSRTSLLTGLSPDITQVYDLQTFFRNILPDVVTLPELFKANNYHAIRIGKIFHYGVPAEIGTNGMDDSLSWSARINPTGRDKTEEYKVVSLRPGNSLGSTLSYLSAEGSDEEQTDGKIATEAIKYLNQKRDKPFFLAVGFFRPHTPFVAPRKYFDMYPLDRITLTEVPENDLADIPSAALNIKIPNWGLSEYNLKEAIRAYYASISFMDAQFGRILDGLKENKLDKNTIIVFWSDHGYNLGQHGQWMKQSLFENAVRVPLIISVPGGLTGRISKRTVGLIDIYPTLSELCNLPANNKLSGISLVPLLKKPDMVWIRPAFSQVTRGSIRGYSVRTDQWRYTEWDGGKAGVELYNELNDPGEITNLAKTPENKKVVSELSALIKKKSAEDTMLTHKYINLK